MEANSNQGKPVIKVTICIEVAQGDIFMEQKMRFGLVGNNEKKTDRY